YLLVAALLVLATRHDTAALLIFTVLLAATVAIAWRADAASAAVVIAAALASLVMVHWALGPETIYLIAPPSGGFEASSVDIQRHLLFGFVFAALFGGAGFMAQQRSSSPPIAILWASAAVFAPLAIL